MAIQKNITDSFGTTHASSYTRITYFILSGTDKLEIGMGIYHNAAARSKSDLSSEKRMLDQDVTMVNRTDFNTFFQDSVLDNNNVSPLKQAYAWLKTQTDVMGQNWTTGTTDV